MLVFLYIMCDNILYDHLLMYLPHSDVHFFLLCCVCLLLLCQSQSYLTTDGQSASLPWCQVTTRARDQFFFLLEISFRQSLSGLSPMELKTILY
jgi:hypothetical protein